MRCAHLSSNWILKSIDKFPSILYSILKGCRVKDHQVIISSNQASEPSQTACCLFANGNMNKDQVYRDLIMHRDAVCIQHQRVVTVCLPSELVVFV